MGSGVGAIAFLKTVFMSTKLLKIYYNS